MLSVNAMLVPSGALIRIEWSSGKYQSEEPPASHVRGSIPTLEVGAMARQETDGIKMEDHADGHCQREKIGHTGWYVARQHRPGSQWHSAGVRCVLARVPMR